MTIFSWTFLPEARMRPSLSMSLALGLPLLAQSQAGPALILSFGKGTPSLGIRNPAPGQWNPFQLLKAVPPNLRVITLKHLPIKDNRQVDVEPVLSAMLQEVPEGPIDLEAVFTQEVGRQGFTLRRQAYHRGKLYAQGTSEYGGYLHNIEMAFLVKDRWMGRAICDSTDTVHGKVAEDFAAWTRAMEFIPAEPTPNQPLPEGGMITVDKIPGGYRMVSAEGAASTTAQLLGQGFSPVEGPEGQRPTFQVGPLLIQWFHLDQSMFMEGPLANPRRRFEAHYDWEVRYLRDTLKQQNLGAPEIGAHTYQEVRGWDGILRPFYSWKMKMGDFGKEAVHLIQTAPNPKGLTVLVVVVPNPKDEPEALKLLESYRFSFQPLSPRVWTEIASEREAARTP